MSMGASRLPKETATKSWQMQDVRWRQVADAASQTFGAVERDGLEEASNAPAQETIALDLSRNASCTRARAGKAPPEMTMAASVNR